MKNSRTELLIALLLIGLAFLSRMLPHAANFSPILGLALFSGAVIRQRWLALLVPLVGILLSDVMAGAFATPYPGMGFVYASYIFVSLLGMTLISRESIFLLRHGILASLLFFVISNLGVWATSGMYPLTAAGITQCYVQAVPFFTNTILSTLMTTFVLFTAYGYLSRKVKLEIHAQN